MGVVSQAQMNQPHARIELHNPVAGVGGMPCVDINLMTAAAQLPGKLTNINTHPSRIFGSEFSERTGMHAQHRNPQSGDVYGHGLLSFGGRPLRAFWGRPEMDVE